MAVAGVLVAAALIGPSAATAHEYDYDPDTGTTTPSQQGPVGPGAGHDPCAGPGAGGGPGEPALPEVSAEAAIVVDRATGEVLGAKDPDTCRAPASVTKIMVALIASEAITAGEVSLSDTVTIPADVSFEIWDEPGALMPGDTISLRDLLYMMLVDSRGDAATSVAMHVGGYPSLSGLDAREAFIEQMNDRADELGLHDTNFVNVSGADPEDLGPSDDGEGIDDDQEVPGYEDCTDGNHFDIAECAHYSTARDLAALADVVLDDPLLARIVSTPRWTTTTWRRSNLHSSSGPHTSSGSDISSGPGSPIPMFWSENNTNQLLPGRLQAYPGAYGVKTGTSFMAGEVLVSAARNPTKPTPGPVLGNEASPVQLPSGSQSRQSNTSASGESNRDRRPLTSDVIAVVLGSGTDPNICGDRFDDSKIVLDFALGRTP